MTAAQIRTIVHELDECRSLIDLAESHLKNDQPEYAETAIAVMIQYAERLRGALPEPQCTEAYCAAIEARSAKRTKAA